MDNENEKSAGERIQPISVSLGQDGDRARRLARLQKMADVYSKGKISTMIQMLADGTLSLIVTPERLETPSVLAEMADEIKKQ